MTGEGVDLTVFCFSIRWIGGAVTTGAEGASAGFCAFDLNDEDGFTDGCEKEEDGEEKDLLGDEKDLLGDENERLGDEKEERAVEENDLDDEAEKDFAKTGAG